MIDSNNLNERINRIENCLDFIDSFNELNLNESSRSENRPQKMQTNSEKKLARYARIVERNREKRKIEHKNRKSKNKSTIICEEIQIAIDLSYCHLMSSKELAKLARQIGRVWGFQKVYSGASITLVSPSDIFFDVACRFVSGFENFSWRIENTLEFTEKRLIYLSPDSELEPLLNLEENDVFVIGGLVDETGKGSLSREKADSLNYLCRRLPIPEFMIKKSGTFNVMLTINQVVEILLKYAHSKNWKESLGSVVPKRSGYVVEN